MDKKKDLLKLDFYDILEIHPNANEKQIRKAYRNRARSCHPDKNPDNPNAAEKFIELENILEILLNSEKKLTYDKLLKGRKEAEIRAKEFSSEIQYFKNKLEKQERDAKEVREKKNLDKLSENYRNRLKEENKRVIEEELEKIEKDLLEEAGQSQPKPSEVYFTVEARWRKTSEWKGFSREEIQRIFYKWGEINAWVMTENEERGKALIEYAEKSGAEMAVSYELGLPDKVIQVRHSTKPHKKQKKKFKTETDNESILEMNQRRAEERNKLIEEIRRSENIE